ncbi:GerAB/ArcD/ProY family transporter [Peribacillus sp. NPDC094092]|uniref:GerAB/ArcD/ProY family transporter n=1 Tax=Peribacillus sp. NPDC094092 TaxID=3390611 RepID=UPI003CFC884E
MSYIFGCLKRFLLGLFHWFPDPDLLCFETVTGIAFCTMVVSYWLLFVPFYGFSNLVPLDYTLLEILKGTKSTSLSMIGFEMLLMYYPFIQNAETSKKYAHGGALATTLLKSLLYLVSIVFYLKHELAITIWPTLTMTSIIEWPFIQRFEYIVVSWWFIIIIVNMVIPLWAASGGETLI